MFKKMMPIIHSIFLVSCSTLTNHTLEAKPIQTETRGGLMATFAGGCFWCMEGPFEKLPGVYSVVSGYTGGPETNPTYKAVASGQTGHTEAVQVRYNPAVISYGDLLKVYWMSMDPTDKDGQFADRGRQYRPEIFTHNAYQQKIAKQSKKELEAANMFAKPIVVPITEYTAFYPAEEYHQDYYKTNPIHYKTYRKGSGREGFLQKVWGKELTEPIQTTAEVFHKPNNRDLQLTLSPLQYRVTQENGTERPFQNEYWDNNADGIYVDIVSGEPLFSSQSKFKSGTGWPSFYQPLSPNNVVEKTDKSHNMTRIEVRSSNADSHLGHLFHDGPQPTGLRYCINSAAIKFIAKEDLQKQGYGEFLGSFE